jgi:hypothetical protein
VQRDVLLAQSLAQPVQIRVEVLFGEEAGLAVVAKLDDMQRHGVEQDAGAAWHARRLRRYYR